MPIREISSRKIIRATPDQAEALTQIAFAAKRHWGYPERWIAIWSPLLTITPEFIEQYETYAALLNGRPVGFCALSMKDKKANVEHLWILPEYIGKGIGTELFKHMLARCKEAGACMLQIESDPNAQGFYERLGAKQVGEVVGQVDGQPRILPLLEIEL